MLAADAPAAWHWEAGASYRTLTERDASGARLLRESGPLARLRITVQPSWAIAGRLEFSASAAFGRLDYAGRTQAGAPLATRSRHTEGEAGVRWRPVQAFAWGVASVSLDALVFRRAIGATPGVNALVETSTLWMPGVRWDSPVWRIAGLPVSAHAGWRESIDHRLRVDYGGLFDASTLRGGRRDDVSLGLCTVTPGGWSISLEGSRARQSASELVPVYRAALPAGTVRQPRIAIDDIGLTLSRSF